MALLTPHWQALTPGTRQAFQIAAALPFIQRYYLAGGTGLALHLGHRFSVDLDFFASAPDALGPDERSVLRTAFDDPTLAVSLDKDMTFVANWRAECVTLRGGRQLLPPGALSPDAGAGAARWRACGRHRGDRRHEAGGHHVARHAQGLH